MDISQAIIGHKFLNKTHNDYLAALQMHLDNLQYIKSTSVHSKVNELIRSNSKYFQGISELLLWFLFEERNIEYSIDYPSSDVPNCDLSVEVDGIRINIEAKSPKIETNENIYKALEDNSAAIKISTPFRHSVPKEINDAIQKAILDDIKEKFGSREGGVAFFSGLPSDNPLFQSISKAVEQLPEADGKNLNLIFIPTTTEQMGKYLDYLKNPETGIFTNKFTGVSGDGNHKWELTREHLSNIAGVIVSNIFDKHKQYSSDGWDIENSVCLFIDNDNGSKLFENDDIIKTLEKVFAFSIDEGEKYIHRYVEEVIEKIKEEVIKQEDGSLLIDRSTIHRYVNNAFNATFFYKYIKEKNENEIKDL